MDPPSEAEMKILEVRRERSGQNQQADGGLSTERLQNAG
jgi:hypothetical protein